ncbi:MAG: VOC family protein [Vicinamibacterales bacterium]
MTAVTPQFGTFLWFQRDAEQAAEFYTTLFPDARITATTRWGAGGPGPAGSVMTVAFELGGQRFTAINGGPHYTLTGAVSIVVSCATQAEIDRYWAALTSGGGTAVQCGWAQDRFGLSWQVLPASLGALMSDPDPARAGRVGKALLAMQKIDLAALERAHRGEEPLEERR